MTKLITITTIPESQEYQVNSEVRTAHSEKKDGCETVLDSASGDSDADCELVAHLFAYFTEKRISTNCDPLFYWKVRAVQWPQLTLLIRRYLCAPIGSCASARKFQVAKNVNSNERI